MKSTALILLLAIVTAAAPGGETTTVRPAPQARPRLDPEAHAEATPIKPAELPIGESTTVAMSPYTVREKSGPVLANPLIAIPEGVPLPSRSGVLKMVESGVLAEHTGKRFSTALIAHGESGPAGYGCLKLGCSISW